MNVRRLIQICFGGAILLLSAVATSGCEESVNPIIGSDLPYTIWGFMNAGADTQQVRVFSINDRLRPDTVASIDAAVYSVDLTTGERREWTYRAVRFDSVSVGHIFWSPFRAIHTHRYRLDVERSDGATSSVVVQVPPPVALDVSVPENGTRIDVRFLGDIPNLVGVHVTYHAMNIPPANVWPAETRVHPPVDHSVTIIYDELLVPDADGWQVTVDMQRDYEILQRAFLLSCLITEEGGSAPDIWLNAMEVTAVAADSSWNPPGGVFDPDVLAHPGTFSNVSNGYGFFGAGHGLRYRWTPTLSARRTAGFKFEPRCAFTAMPDNPECLEPPVPCLGTESRNLWEQWLE